MLLVTSSRQLLSLSLPLYIVHHHIHYDSPPPLPAFCDLCQVQSKVNAGYQLPHPQGCHEATYCLMRHCWARQPSDRPSFSEIIRRHLEPLAVKLARWEVRWSGGARGRVEMYYDVSINCWTQKRLASQRWKDEEAFFSLDFFSLTQVFFLPFLLSMQTCACVDHHEGRNSLEVAIPATITIILQVVLCAVLVITSLRKALEITVENSNFPLPYSASTV